MHRIREKRKISFAGQELFSKFYLEIFTILHYCTYMYKDVC